MTWYAMKYDGRYQVTLSGFEWYERGPKTAMVTDVEYGWTTWVEILRAENMDYAVHHYTEDEKPRGVALSLSGRPMLGDWVEVADPYVWPIPELEKR